MLIQQVLETTGTPDDPFSDYLLKPLYWVTLFGFLPVLLVEIAFGAGKGKHGTQ